MINLIFFTAARLLIGLIFFYSGFTKLTKPIENFIGVLTSYEFIPYFLTTPIAHTLPWVELLAGAFFIVGYGVRKVSVLIACLASSFIFVMSLTYLTTGAFPANCGCFGEGSLIQFTGSQILLLDLSILLASVKLALQKRHPWTVDAWMDSAPSSSVS